jgi:NSS family neurotransmitter:Na+ symporter
MEQKRSSFTGKIGFVLAAAGSAVGLGNIWRFPYLAAEYGGGMFLLTYIILSLTFGFTLMVAEIAIGRKTGLSPIGAFQKLSKKFTFVGYLASIVPLLILPYYSVIGGWVAKYLFTYVTGAGTQAAGASFFGGFVSSAGEPIGWFLLFIGITALIVLFGVEKGIEKVSKILMPVLVILSVFIAIYVCFMPGALEGVKYYLIPNFANFSMKTVVAATGQLFYSMSLAMGIMITYGSYMKKDVSIEASAHQIELFDTGIAFLAGLMIIPAMFVGNPNPDLSQNGVGLMFKALPKVFESMWGGHFIGGVFFVLVLLAALTSSISLMETVVSVVQDKLKWNRKLTCLVVFIASVAIGLPSAFGFSIWSSFTVLGMDILTAFDYLTNSVLMPVIALLTAILIGYIVKPKTVIEEVEVSGKFRLKWLFNAMIKYVVPVCLVVILIFGVLGGLASSPSFADAEWLKWFTL